MRPLNFKETLQNDVKAVFLNPAEFGEPHVVNGRKMRSWTIWSTSSGRSA